MLGHGHNGTAMKGRKRKVSQTSAEEITETAKESRTFTRIAAYLEKRLDDEVPGDTIKECGLAPLKRLASHPEHVLDLAKQKLGTWPYADVQACYRRLYEDASLYLVVRKLRSESLAPDSRDHTPQGKRVNLCEHDLLSTVVELLDGARVTAGAPGRSTLIENVFKMLEPAVGSRLADFQPNYLQIFEPAPFHTPHAVIRAQEAIEFSDFQLHLDSDCGPIIIPDAFEDWPALHLWSNTTYLKERTLAGLRPVPVEIGSSYNDAKWTQKVMPFGDFVDKYLVPDNPPDKGYLAQHELFEQIPALREDIGIPDYCYTSPPPVKGAAARTAGLAKVKELNEPTVNAWLGPAGTKSPLHTDPYHNILCQVVGYKYVRLYSPNETQKLYPDSIDEAGIDMSNTSQVDVYHFRPGAIKEEEKVREIEDNFPNFKDAMYQEALLGPGECLYIPLGWWHYVESQTTSFSVSFWWN